MGRNAPHLSPAQGSNAPLAAKEWPFRKQTAETGPTSPFWSRSSLRNAEPSGPMEGPAVTAFKGMALPASFAEILPLSKKSDC